MAEHKHQTDITKDVIERELSGTTHEVRHWPGYIEVLFEPAGDPGHSVNLTIENDGTVLVDALKHDDTCNLPYLAKVPCMFLKHLSWKFDLSVEEHRLALATNINTFIDKAFKEN